MEVEGTGEREPAEDPKRMGATVKALREAYGWQAGKFAIQVGVSHSHLANIEAGRKRCTPPIARRMAEVLGVPMAAITTRYTPEEIAGPIGSAA